MGRKKEYTDEILEGYCKSMQNALRESGCLYSQEMVEETGLNKTQISKALKYQRRGFDGSNLTDMILSSPRGYFMPSKGREVLAYTVQYYLDATSRLKTIAPFIEYARVHWPDQLKEALDNKNPEEVKDENSDYWENFNRVILNMSQFPIEKGGNDK